MTDSMTRRDFVKTTAALATASVVATTPATAAGNRIRLGIIGTGNRGTQLIAAALPNEDAEFVAACDVFDPHIDKAIEKIGKKVDTYKDYRKLLDRKDIDAVIIATPDHWHALQAVDACEAGKDVYVEKPLSVTVHEGRRIVEAARRNNRIVQVGTQRRSSPLFAELVQKVRDGFIGKVTVARCYRLDNMWPNGIGKAADAPPPQGLDWDMWLGPRPQRPFRETIAPYKFRWWLAYSSQMANWGVHYLDIARWMLKEEAPSSIVAMGGRFAVNDDRDIPDTMEVTFEMPSGCLAVFGQYEASGNAAMKKGFLELRGTLGTMYIDDRNYEIVPEKGGQFQDEKPRLEPVNEKRDEQDHTRLHMRNFFDCIKSRQTPNGDIEVGHRSTTFCLLANISLATKARLEWDPGKERFTSPENANELLHYEYRSPWKLL